MEALTLHTLEIPTQKHSLDNKRQRNGSNASTPTVLAFLVYNASRTPCLGTSSCLAMTSTLTTCSRKAILITLIGGLCATIQGRVFRLRRFNGQFTTCHPSIYYRSRTGFRNYRMRKKDFKKRKDRSRLV